ncbi:S-layer homology domain-containing protein [Thermicanus aegyptius]|uniref:S-layer homology domain-containing protein n=1 Tax=Thermicanus aegyptius TaxID=94009 RepID=UPI00040EE2E5|nr:S-layer homology domain-containing protein [Thermicanus aegyptius]
MRKRKGILVALVGFLFLLSIQAFAFEDVSNPDDAKILSQLQSKGIISGTGTKNFAPNRPLTYAEAAALYVKAFSLTLPDYRWIKEPKASDMYSKVAAQAWYAKPFMILFYHQIPFPRDVNPQDQITREEFAYYLHQVIVKTKNPAVIEMWVDYADVDQVKKEYQGAINDLIHLKVVALNDQNKFRPKEPITRMEAALMIYQAMGIPGEENGGEPMPPVDQKPEPVQVIREKVTDEVYRVTLSWGEKPNPGYRITIDNIQFMDHTAVIYYSLHYPDPKLFYPQVITEAKVSTYIGTGYEVKTVQKGIGRGSPIQTPPIFQHPTDPSKKMK